MGQASLSGNKVGLGRPHQIEEPMVFRICSESSELRIPVTSALVPCPGLAHLLWHFEKPSIGGMLLYFEL